MSPFRPDIVATWVFRMTDGDPEILLLRRSPGRILAGLWQCVTGSVEANERVAAGALREVREETGLRPADIEAFYDLDMVNLFHEPSIDGVYSEAVFAVRVRADAIPTLSAEHDALRWVRPAEAGALTVWPAYRMAIERIESDLLDRDRAPWFELTPDGLRRTR